MEKVRSVPCSISCDATENHTYIEIFWRKIIVKTCAKICFLQNFLQCFCKISHNFAAHLRADGCQRVRVRAADEGREGGRIGAGECIV